MSIHVFTGGMSNNICPVLKWSAVDGCCKCIIYDQRYAMSMSQFCKLLNIQNCQSRISNGLTYHSLGIRTKCLVNLFYRSIRIYERTLHAHFMDSCCIQIEGSSVYFCRTYNVIPCLAQISNRIEVRCLTGRCEHGSHTALKFTDLLCYRIVGRVLKSAVEISIFLQCKQSAHFFRRIILKCRALIDRQYSRLTFLWFPSCLYADGIWSELFTHS